MRLEQTYIAEHDYYEALGVSHDATSIEVQAAFEKLCGQIDLQDPSSERRLAAAEKMLRLTQAYEVLSNPIQRSHYDIRTFGRSNLPINNRVENLFREGIKAFKKSKPDLAMRYFKEITQLFPHRSLYRVHLAISYADKHWLTFTEAELETALRLDPEDDFAKETIARILFKLPDRKHYNPFQSSLNRQVAALAAMFFSMTLLLVTGLPQQWVGQAMKKVSETTQELVSANPKNAQIEENPGLPEDMVLEMKQKQQSEQKSSSAVSLAKLPADFVPEKPFYDYTNQIPTEKTFYPDQSLVVIKYKDGSILTYRPQDLKGWKEDEKNGAVMITRDNELIPSPASLPLKLPDGSPADLKASGFPANLFPEYGVTTTPATPADSGTPASPAETTTQPQEQPPANSGNSSGGYGTYQPSGSQPQSTGVQSL